MPRGVDFAWAAGFIDGEGSFYCIILKRRSKTGKVYRYFRISATQADAEVLNKLANILDGRVYGPYKHAGGLGKKPIYKFHLQAGKSALKLFQSLYPYLSKKKRIQGRKALKKCGRIA